MTGAMWWPTVAASLACLVVLAWGGGAPRRWSTRRRARPAAPRGSPPPSVPADRLPLVADALAALLESGLPLADCLQALGTGASARSLGAVGSRLRWGADWGEAWAASPGTEALSAPLLLSRTTGAPAVALLRDAAGEARRTAVREQEAAVQALTVRLVLPLGLCALPAFVCLGIVPVALALVPWG